MPDLDKLANSTTSTVISRLTIMITPILIGALGFLIVGLVNDIKNTQEKFWTVIKSVSDNIGEIKTTVAVNSNVLTTHIKEDDEFEARVQSMLADHETRLRAVPQWMPSSPSPFTFQSQPPPSRRFP